MIRLSFWAILAMTKQQVLLLLRYPVNLMANFCLTLVMIIVVTVTIMVFSPVETSVGAEMSLPAIALYGFIIYLLLQHTIWTIGIGIYKEKVAGTLTSFYLSPASPFLNLLTRAAVALTWVSMAGIIGLLFAQTIVGPLSVQHLGLTLVILLFVIGNVLGIGFVISGLALRFGGNVEIVANFIEFGLLAVCAIFFPFAILPPALQTVSRLIPLSYSVDLLRTVAMGGSQPELLPLNVELIIVVISGVLGPLIGYWFYHFCEGKVRQQGLL